MANEHPLWDRADKYLIGSSVGSYFFYCINMDNSVTSMIGRASPQPASRVRLWRPLVMESL